MELLKIESIVKQYKSLEELDLSDQNLMKLAQQTMLNAYAPYSNFLVGCALLLANGEIVVGSNQENMAYPSGMCAERVAIYSAGANFPGIPILTAAITAKAANFDLAEPIACCGACLQSMSEYEVRYQKPIRIILHGEGSSIWLAEAGTKTFLPFQFNVFGLKK